MLLIFLIALEVWYNLAKEREKMKEKIELFAQILNLKRRLNAEILKAGQKIIEQINEAKAFERQYQEDKKKNEFRYRQIMQERKCIK